MTSMPNNLYLDTMCCKNLYIRIR
ncbi:hypothetical protein KL86CLO1_10058 [uncultured Eubacteriales bacterium]|uniref:Uncharacterized protein n=1 Tax=uncultured Eubacteriales bacterium TaxID=172733 RepID=A0A212IUV6_9FIRM|nr:hypothetical protein KL86CLO1_10058 [uncultured Eubacteriales bacterium]